jgi:hypothetical protein
MAKTAVADIIIPTEFEKYAIERTAELSRFGESGIIEIAPEFDALAQGGGREVKMPFWKDLTAARQILSDAATLAVKKIAADTDIARIHNDAQVWGVNHLAKVVSGNDPMQGIVDVVGGYWARTDEGLVISCLKGLFGGASMAGNLLAIHSETVAGTNAATRLNGATFVDACANLDDGPLRAGVAAWVISVRTGIVASELGPCECGRLKAVAKGMRQLYSGVACLTQLLTQSGRFSGWTRLSARHRG